MIKVWIWVCIVAAGVAAMAMSYAGLYGLAELVGFGSSTAALLPVAIDITVIAATLVWLSAGVPTTARGYGRLLALASIGISVLGNATFHGLAGGTHWWLSSAVASTPPAFLAALVHLGALLVRRQEAGDTPGGNIQVFDYERPIGPLPATVDEDQEIREAADAAGVQVGRTPLQATLYRLVDDTGELLYVGVTSGPLSMRLAVHKRQKPWWNEVAEVITERYENRSQALAAERECIATGKPRYNIHRGVLSDAVTQEQPDDDGTLLEKTRILLESTGGKLGRHRLMEELGISEHRAKTLLAELKTNGNGDAEDSRLQIVRDAAR